MRIAICDNEPIFLTILEDAVTRFSLTYNLDCEVIKFSTSQELLAAKMDYSILLLDVMLEEDVDGLYVGSILRQMGLTAQIIIITAWDNRYKDGYKISAHRYIEKPFKQEEFNEALSSAIQILKNRSRIMTIRFGKEERWIDVSTIILIESFFRNRRIYFEDNGSVEFFETTLTWKQILQQLPSAQFEFVQKSFLVHFKYLISRTTNTVTVKYKGTLNISKLYIKHFDSAHLQYLHQ